MPPTAAVDLGAIKARQQQAWASGDYSAVGAMLQLISERLVDTADFPAGSRVLDVAGGSGNAALAAARAGCDAVCTDYVAPLLERARERAAAERLRVEVREADAEALPFPDASFDGVTSAIGVMFAADHAQAASEILRVCRPGGTIALASWTPESFVGEMFRMVAAHVPPPAGLNPPMRWGTEEGLAELLGEAVSRIAHERRVYTFRFRTAEHFVDLFLAKYGPTHRALAALDADGRRAFREDFVDLVSRHDRRRGNGPVAVPASYLESVARRAG
jgi:ubiquinone/menaquinone biosynthesis C-methylase UbiE